MYAFLKKDAPKYITGYSICIAFTILSIIACITYGIACLAENRRRDRSAVDVGFGEEEPKSPASRSTLVQLQKSSDDLWNGGTHFWTCFHLFQGCFEVGWIKTEFEEAQRRLRLSVLELLVLDGLAESTLALSTMVTGVA